MNAILSVNINKINRNDARGIANAMRTGMFFRIHEKPQKAIDRRVVLSIRRCLVKQRTDMKNHVCGILKTCGIRLSAISPEKLHERVQLLIQELGPLVHQTIEGALELFDELNKKISQLNKELLKISQEDEKARLLMTTPGIGPIVAVTYKTEIHNPCRFSHSRAVGAYLGMTSTQYSSGETCRQGRISKCGSKKLRSLLTRTKKWSKLKAWGIKLMRKKRVKKASLAVARKLSVIIHRMLIEEKAFQYGEVTDKAA